MNILLVFILLCLDMAQTRCITPSPQMTDAINLLHGKIRSLLSSLSEEPLPPNISCHMLNSTDLPGLDWVSLADPHFSLIQCYMLKFSQLITELKKELEEIAQLLQDMVPDSQGPNQSCSFPSSTDDLENAVFSKCVLQFVDERLSNATLTYR